MPPDERRTAGTRRVLAGERPLGTGVACDLEFFRRQLFLPLGLGLFDFFYLEHACPGAGCIKFSNSHQFRFP